MVLNIKHQLYHWAVWVVYWRQHAVLAVSSDFKIFQDRRELHERASKKPVSEMNFEDVGDTVEEYPNK